MVSLLLSITTPTVIGQPADAPFGIEKRIPWTTSRVKGSPEPPSPFLTERVFPKLKFEEPLEMVPLPGGKRWVLAEHAGRIYSFTNDPNVAKPDMFADMKQWNREVTEVYSVAFHPQFASNHFVYIWYILKPELPDGTHISRFEVTQSDPPTVDLSTEVPIIAWKSGGHNGGCLRFGKDGMMYISTGDGAGPDPPDGLSTGQDISDLLSSILRIDVDHATAGKGYAVPTDNPFVNTVGARPEVWAYGLRNPWRMSIDQKTGDVWVGDVGWELWEMIYRVQAGGNYGWSIMEGTRQAIHADGKRGPTPILPPIVEHPHSEAASITGGYVYHGTRLPQLKGAYIYGDYQTGKIWELRYDGSRVTKHRELVDTPLAVVSFAEDEDGELYIVNFGGDIHRLVANPDAGKASKFPRKLSETGLFSSLKENRVAAGVIPYSINSELWSDGAQAERIVALPGMNVVTQDRDKKWVFPKDSVWAKTLWLERRAGEAASRFRVETQMIHYDGDNWNAYSYQWNDAQTEATLVGAAGAEKALVIEDKDAPGGKRRQTWRYQSRAECLRCHNMWCNYLLGFTGPQLNRAHNYSAAPAPQLQTLAHIGAVPEGLLKEKNLPAYAKPTDPTADLGLRARAYLHANCSHCHREHAGGSVLTFMDYEFPLAKANLVDAKPAQGGFNIPGARIVAPGDPDRSVLLYRMSKLGKGHMPYLGSSVVDERGVQLLSDWIAQLAPVAKADDPDLVSAAQRRQQHFLALVLLEHGESLPAAERDPVLASFLSDASGALALTHALAQKRLPRPIQEAAIAQGSQRADLIVRDLFERFLPEEKRIKTLGPSIDPRTILALKGEATRGRQLFTQEGRAQCNTCHRLQKVGRDFGPDLSHVGKKYDRARLLEQILSPSKIIDAPFIAYSVETSDDLSLTGFIVRRNDREIVLKDATATEKVIPLAQVKHLQAQKLSLMPEGLLQGMTAQDAADLLAYLTSLK